MAANELYLIKNCLRHSERLTCVDCERGFFLTKRICLQIPPNDIIPNCAINLDQTTCRVCDDNFVPSFDRKKCLPVPADPNCLKYEPLTCQECNDGYFLNRNLGGESLPLQIQALTHG